MARNKPKPKPKKSVKSGVKTLKRIKQNNEVLKKYES